MSTYSVIITGPDAEMREALVRVIGEHLQYGLGTTVKQVAGNQPIAMDGNATAIAVDSFQHYNAFGHVMIVVTDANHVMVSTDPGKIVTGVGGDIRKHF